MPNRFRILTFVLSIFSMPAYADIACVQEKLSALGLNAGAADGVLGNRTLSAAARYSKDFNSTLSVLTKENSEEWCLELTNVVTRPREKQSSKRSSNIELFNYSSTRFCLQSDVRKAPSHPVIDRKRRKLIEVLEWFNLALNSAKIDRALASQVAAQLTRLAKNNAYLRLNWRGRGPNPAHWQTNLLKNLAFAVNIIDHKDAWQPGQRTKVIRWGNKLYRNSHFTYWGRKQSYRWPDTVATASAAYMSWGVVAPNTAALKEGRSDFRRVARLLKSRGGTRAFFRGGLHRKLFPADWGLRLEDKMLGDLVIAAHVAKRAGIDLFNYAPSGISLYEAIVGWQETLFSQDRSALKGQDLSFLTPYGHERSWSWTEYFIFNYPDDPRTKKLRDMSESIKLAGYYRGLATGPSTCFFR